MSCLNEKKSTVANYSENLYRVNICKTKIFKINNNGASFLYFPIAKTIISYQRIIPYLECVSLIFGLELCLLDT